MAGPGIRWNRTSWKREKRDTLHSSSLRLSVWTNHSNLIVWQARNRSTSWQLHQHFCAVPFCACKVSHEQGLHCLSKMPTLTRLIFMTLAQLGGAKSMSTVSFGCLSTT